MKQKPILVGMNNPLSVAPDYALFPAPEGSTGHRLWNMLSERTGAMRKQYLDTFERMNLVIGPWDRKEAAKTAAELARKWYGTDRKIVVLGEEVRRAFGLEKNLLHPVLFMGNIYRQVPHPSGRNLWYNDESNRVSVGMLLEELYRDYHKT